MGPQIAKRTITQYAIITIPEKTAIEIRHLVQNFYAGFLHVLIVPDLPTICSLGIAAR